VLEDSALIELAKENCDTFREAEISQATIHMERIQIVL
jgi:signal recognition particle GTPase